MQGYDAAVKLAKAQIQYASHWRQSSHRQCQAIVCRSRWKPLVRYRSFRCTVSCPHGRLPVYTEGLLPKAYVLMHGQKKEKKEDSATMGIVIKEANVVWLRLAAGCCTWGKPDSCTISKLLMEACKKKRQKKGPPKTQMAECACGQEKRKEHRATIVEDAMTLLGLHHQIDT